MLRYRLTHPPLLAALAAAGHGSQILLADGNYPHSTGASKDAVLIHLDVAAGLLTVDQVLELIIDAVPLESAAVMVPPEGTEPPAISGYRAMLAAGVEFSSLPRFDFYEAARGRDVALVVATGDQRHYANLLLTIGVLPSA